MPRRNEKVIFTSAELNSLIEYLDRYLDEENMREGKEGREFNNLMRAALAMCHSQPTSEKPSDNG